MLLCTATINLTPFLRNMHIRFSTLNLRIPISLYTEPIVQGAAGTFTEFQVKEF